ncbi:MAG: MSMEG_0565 family glycosyltransferase [Chroococcidiopsidaceae cyanobacterium CP_BM_RX_35]|nr:MSMEG_0565 family glycosyltransferase [Chroococcidiopsidaceae cyanobacterium CP_BM_RX_35]
MSKSSSLYLSNPDLRIALFTYSTKPRGSVVHTLELAEALQDLGQQVCVYALDKDGAGFYRPLRCAYELVPAQPVTGGIDALIEQRIQEFVEYLSQVEQIYDCYHAQDCISANAIAALKQKHQIPHFIRTVHHIEDFNSPYLQDCQEKSIRYPDLCLCVSSQWQAELQEQYQIRAPRVTNGVNTQQFSPHRDGSETALKQQLSLEGWPIYLTIGGIEPRKNSLVLLQAFREVLAQYPQAQLIIAGGATLFDYQAYQEEFFAAAQIAEVPIGKSLLLPGTIPDNQLPALYRLSNAFVFPSLKEGWGLVVLEAMASGVPVVTSNIPPFTEFLSAADALLVDPYSVSAITLAMKTIIQTAVAQPLRQQGLAVCDRYTWRQAAEQHLIQYRQLVQSRA